MRLLENILKFTLLILFFSTWWITYDLINRHSAAGPHTIHWFRPVDAYPAIIQPWTAVIYVFGGLLLPVLPFAFNWEKSKFLFVIVCYTITSSIAFNCYLLWPVGMTRPLFTGDSWGEHLMKMVFKVDMEANCFPSSHTFFAVLGALLVSWGGAGRIVRRLTWLLAVAVCVTTVTTGQHYFIDILGGVGAALAGFGAARMLVDVPGRPPSSGKPLVEPE